MNTIQKLKWSWWNWRRKVRVTKPFQFWKRCKKVSVSFINCQSSNNCSQCHSHISHLSLIVHQTSMWNLCFICISGWIILATLVFVLKRKFYRHRLRSLLYGVPKNFERLFFISFLFVSWVSSSVISDHETRDATVAQQTDRLFEQFLEDKFRDTGSLKRK